ncbi:MAG: zinc-binding dehydrogenase [Clostridiales bacterium]|nr:zinc-binding dehydrogenase [Clostridiales bacterium]
MGKTYKASIFRGPGNIEIIEKTLPDKPGDDEVIVKNLMATICGADWDGYVHGDADKHMMWTDYEFGHEMVSEVVAIGKNVKGVEVGDWVFPNLGYAYQDHHRMATVGGYSEYLVLPKFTMEGQYVGRQQPSVIKLDKSVGLENLVLLEPFSVGCKAAYSMNPKGKSGVVVGSGIIGLSTAIMLKYYGAEKVMMIDFSDFRLKNARQYGLLTCNPQEEDVEAVLKAAFGERGGYGGMRCGADFFFDCIGKQPSIDYFTKYAGYGATLSIVGVHIKPVTIDAVSICYNQQWIKGCGFLPLDKAFADIMDCCRQGTDISRLITQKYPIDKINEAFEMHGHFDVAHKVAISYV